MSCLVGYIRVSTAKQIEGHGLDIQRAAIKQYCTAHDVKLMRIYEDKGLSAFKDRPAFTQMMKGLLKDGSEFDGVIVHDLTRFGRSTADLLLKIAQLQQAGKTFISTKENLDISSKTGRLLLTMLSAIAEFEGETIRERLTAGREYAKIHGTKSGKPMNRPYKEIPWKEFDMLKKVGLSYRKIAKHLGISPETLIKRDKMRQSEFDQEH